MLDLDAITKRCEAATPGPWVLFERDPEGDEITTVCCPCVDHTVYPEDEREPHPQAEHCGKCVLWSVVDSADGALRHGSGEFIAHARTDLPALVAEVKRLREALARIVAESESDDGLTAWDGAEIARAALSESR